MASTNPYRTVTRRDFLRLAATSGAALLLADACGGDRPSVAPTPDAGTPGAQGGTVKWAEFYSTLTAGAAAAAGIDGAANKAWVAAVVHQFESENAGWKVELETVPYGQVDQRSAVDLNANVSHDLVFVTPQLMARHALIGDLLDLEPFISKLPFADQQDLSWSPAWQASRVKGKQLAIPVGLHTYALAYNRELCQKAGVDLSGAGLSLDQLVVAGGKLTGRDQKTWGLALPWPDARTAVERVYAPLVWHFGGTLFDEVKGVATFGGDAGRQAAQWLLDMITKQKIAALPLPTGGSGAGDAGLEAFTRGQAAAVLGFASGDIGALQAGGMVSGCLPATRACRAERAGVAPLPTAGQAAFTGGRCLAIHALSQQPEMAFRLLRVILRPENLRTYPDASLPARLSTWQTNEYKTSFYEAWLAAARKGRPMPQTPYYWELTDTVGAALAAVLSQKSAPADALQKAEDQWNSRYSAS